MRDYSCEQMWPCPTYFTTAPKVPQVGIDLEQQVISAVHQATQEPHFVFGAVANGSMITGLSTVFFIRPKSKTCRTLHFICVPTDWLLSQVVDGLACRQRDARAEFFSAMLAYERTYLASGWIFEEMAKSVNTTNV